MNYRVDAFWNNEVTYTVLDNAKKGEARGYVWGRQDGPSPRPGFRIVSEAGKVLETVQPDNRLSIGVVVGDGIPQLESAIADAQIRLENARKVRP